MLVKLVHSGKMKLDGKIRKLISTFATSATSAVGEESSLTHYWVGPKSSPQTLMVWTYPKNRGCIFV